MPYRIRHIPTIIAVYTGFALEKAARYTTTKPKIKINTDAIFDNASSPKRIPEIPASINNIEIECNKEG